MDDHNALVVFQDKKIRRIWHENEWYFSIIDIIAVLTESVDPPAYWRKLKQRLKEEGNETVTNCHALKMPAQDWSKSLTNCYLKSGGVCKYLHNIMVAST